MQSLNNMSPWDALMKRMVWHQLGEIENKKISSCRLLPQEELEVSV